MEIYVTITGIIARTDRFYPYVIVSVGLQVSKSNCVVGDDSVEY